MVRLQYPAIPDTFLDEEQGITGQLSVRRLHALFNCFSRYVRLPSGSSGGSLLATRVRAELDRTVSTSVELAVVDLYRDAGHFSTALKAGNDHEPSALGRCAAALIVLQRFTGSLGLGDQG